MGIYYNVAIPAKRENYWLGTISSARTNLLYFLEKYIGEIIVLYGDEIHGWCDDTYGIDINESLYANEGYHQLNADSHPILDSEWVKNHTLTHEEFSGLLEEIGGKQTEYLGHRNFSLKE